MYARHRSLALCLALVAASAGATPPQVLGTLVRGAVSELEKAKKAADKKLEAFEKAWDASKNLARKTGEALEKDVATLDEALSALRALDAAAADERQAKRDQLVSAAKESLGSAHANKATADIEKKFAKLEKDFDPEKKKLENVDPKTIERAKKDLEPAIAALEGDSKKEWEAKRDAFFAKLERNVASARVDDVRNAMIEAPVVAPADGAETIAPMEPTWCEGVLASNPKAFANYRPSNLPVGPEITTSLDGLQSVVQFSCVDPSYDKRQKWVAAYRQQLRNRYGLSAATSERMLMIASKLYVNDQAVAQAKALCDQVAPLAQGTAAERGVRSMIRIAVQCGNRRSKENEFETIDLDVPGGIPSQLARAQLVAQLLPQDPADESDSYLLSKASTIGTLVAAVPLNAAEAEQEIVKLGLNELGQLRALTQFYTMKARLDAWVKVFRGLSSKLPKLDALVFDAPAAAVARFEKDLPAMQPLLDLILAMEAQQANGLNGCAEKLWKHLPAELKGKKDALRDLEFTTPTAPLLMYALTLCGQHDADAPVMETIFRAWADRMDSVRGPIGAAYQGYVRMYNQLADGKPKAAFDSGRRSRGAGEALALPAPERAVVPQPQLASSIFGNANPLNLSIEYSGGVVKNIEKKGALVHITFRTEKYKVPDLKCVETNKIDRITPDGQILYRSQCTKIGEHEEESTPEPIDVPHYAAGGVTVGGYVIPTGLPNGREKGRGWVVEAYDSKARGKRTSLFGVAQ